MKKLPKIVLIIVGAVVVFFVLICIVGLVIGSLGSSKAAVPTEIVTVLATDTAEPTSPPNTEVPSRCVPASQGQIDRIRSGVKAIDANNDVREVWAVKSNDFKSVWFVAAKVYGAGMENGTPEAGVWAINGDLATPGITMSVDGFAQKFSDWPDGSTTDANTTMQDDGALAAKDCAQK